MKAMIAYASRYGTTEKCATMLAGLLKEKLKEVELVDLKKDRGAKPDKFDLIIIGGSFVAFRMNSFVKKFVKRNMEVLLNKKTGLFMCGADESWENEIKKGFPQELLNKSAVKGYFGYEMVWGRMNPFIRNMMQKASKTTQEVSKINHENIEKFAEEILKT